MSIEISLSSRAPLHWSPLLRALQGKHKYIIGIVHLQDVQCHTMHVVHVTGNCQMTSVVTLPKYNYWFSLFLFHKRPQHPFNDFIHHIIYSPAFCQTSCTWSLQNISKPFVHLHCKPNHHPFHFLCSGLTFAWAIVTLFNYLPLFNYASNSVKWPQWLSMNEQA